LLASALSFAIIQLTPGGFLALLDLNPKISQETKEQYIALFGLKDPAIVQYFKWLWQVVTQFNFGLSFTYFRPVSSLLLERIPATLLMSLTSIILTWAIAIPLGIAAPSNKTNLSINFSELSVILVKVSPVLSLPFYC